MTAVCGSVYVCDVHLVGDHATRRMLSYRPVLVPARREL